MKAIATHLGKDGKREKFLVDGWPDPGKLGPKDVKTKTIYTGVTNGSERNDLTKGNYAHPDENLPATWGYQNVGEVIEVGSDVEKVKVGDVLYSSMDHIEYCVFNEDTMLFCVLPESVNKAHAALFGMASVAMHTARNADIKLGDDVLVVGAGFIGQIAAQIANAMGARVTIVDIDESRLQTARDIGAAEHVINTSGDGWEKNIKDFSYDVVMDMAGVVGMETKLVCATKHRGRVMFIAGRFEVKYDFNIAQGHEIVIKQNSHFDNADLARICHLTAKGDLKIAPLVQDIVPAKDAKGIYEILRDEPAKLRGTIFDWQ